MRRARLGRTPISISRFGLGTWTWGTTTMPEVASSLLHEFHAAGGTLLDTAPSYGDGAAEGLVGKLWPEIGRREDVVIATKAGVPAHGAPVDVSRAGMGAALEGSLRRLRTDYVDLWQVHVWSKDTDPEEAWSALHDAHAEGKARAVGVSNYDGTALRAAAAFGTPELAAVQTELSLLCRDAEEDVAPAAAELGVSVLAWSPLAGGVLTGKYLDGTPVDSRGRDVTRVQSVDRYRGTDDAAIVRIVCQAAELAGRTATQLALLWVRDHPLVTASLLGPRTIGQLRECLATEEIEADPEITALLTSATDAGDR